LISNGLSREGLQNFEASLEVAPFALRAVRNLPELLLRIRRAPIWKKKRQIKREI
jgi:hypothetical protein